VLDDEIDFGVTVEVIVTNGTSLKEAVDCCAKAWFNEDYEGVLYAARRQNLFTLTFSTKHLKKIYRSNILYQTGGNGLFTGAIGSRGYVTRFIRHGFNEL
jgi:hypothetical protein